MSVEKLTEQEFDTLLQHLPAGPEMRESSSDSPLLRLFASISRDRRADLMTERRCEPGEIVFKEGEGGDAMYVIWSGQMIALKGTLRSPTILGYRGPGDVIGEMALLEDQPRSATIIALEFVRLLRIQRADFQKWVSEMPDIGMTIMSMLSARLRDADNVRLMEDRAGRQLVKQVSRLETEKQQLIDLQQVRQETSDLIVHDLRNPLGVLYGALNMLELMLPEDVLEQNREVLQLASSACERMQRLVDSLLDVSKLETGEMKLKLGAVNLCPLLEDITRRQSLLVQHNNITIRVDIDQLPPVVADVDIVERVITNLMDNAIKYTPAGKEIVVSGEVQGDQLVISITDSGPGIRPEDRERIFERFAQVPEEQRLRGRRGFGLGLTFCRLAVEAHGGKIWVEPGPNGVGSRFAFTLPLTA